MSKPIGELERTGFLLPDRQRFGPSSRRRGPVEIVFTLGGHIPRRRAPTGKRACVPAVRESPRSTVAPAAERYLDGLSSVDRERLEQEAMKSASGFLRETFDGEDQQGPLAEECRKQIVRAFVNNLLSEKHALR